MHEYSLIQALLDRVEAEARTRSASGVSRLSVSIGTQAGVERQLFATAYDVCRRGTLCERAELEITTVEARFACRLCGREVAPGEVLCCPDCGSPARLVSGDEIVLNRIDMEVG
jgi:hydrogenase nickel incorporation protein HypA/HybF